MRYHYVKPAHYGIHYGETYSCDHPVYNSCTLYLSNHNGLAVIQQRFYPATKSTRWGTIDEWLVDALYLAPGFKEFFDERSGPCVNDIYPTVTVRQIMWALKMKPLPKQRWETVFDRRQI